MKLLKSIVWRKKRGAYAAEQEHFRTARQISPGSFLKAHRKHVPVHLRFMTPKRSVKGKFFMKRRFKLHSASLRKRELP